MDKDRARVLVLLLGYLALAIAAIFALDWFIIDAPGGRGMLDLRGFRVCPTAAGLGGACVTIKYSSLPNGAGWFPSFATATFWLTIVATIVIVFQAGTRLLSGHASEGLGKLGYLMGVVLLGLVLFTAYVLQLELPRDASLGMDVHRTWAPSMLLLGHVLGIAVHYYALNQGVAIDDAAASRPTTLPEARVSDRVRRISDPVPVIPARQISGPVMVIPEHVRGKLHYATLTAQITRAGIDARREDCSSLLIMWRDVVGVVARRLPQTYDGTTFVDLVSTAGSTLRLLPWTRLSGDPVEGEGEARARKLVELVVARCPETKVDPATRTFIESTDKAAQLPDLETLAAHDQRLA
jgi:hypothetical protein